MRAFEVVRSISIGADATLVHALVNDFHLWRVQVDSIRFVGGYGRMSWVAPEEWGSDLPALDAPVAERIPTVASLAGPVFVRGTSSSALYLVASGERRKVASTADRDLLAKQWGIPKVVTQIPDATLAAIAAGTPALPAGLVVRTSAQGPSFLIDGMTSRRAISTAAASELTGAKKPRTVTSSVLAAYPIADGAVLPGVVCGSTSYIAVSGVLKKLTAADAAEYGSSLGFSPIEAATCAGLTRSGTAGVFLKYGTKYFEVADGTRTALSKAAYTKRSKGRVPAVTVSKYVLQLVPAAR